MIDTSIRIKWSIVYSSDRNASMLHLIPIKDRVGTPLENYDR
jgi:hypothetical protein